MAARREPTRLDLLEHVNRLQQALIKAQEPTGRLKVTNSRLANQVARMEHDRRTVDVATGPLYDQIKDLARERDYWKARAEGFDTKRAFDSFAIMFEEAFTDRLVALEQVRPWWERLWAALSHKKEDTHND